MKTMFHSALCDVTDFCILGDVGITFIEEKVSVESMKHT